MIGWILGETQASQIKSYKHRQAVCTKNTVPGLIKHAQNPTHICKLSCTYTPLALQPSKVNNKQSVCLSVIKTNACVHSLNSLKYCSAKPILQSQTCRLRSFLSTVLQSRVHGTAVSTCARAIGELLSAKIYYPDTNDRLRLTYILRNKKFSIVTMLRIMNIRFYVVHSYNVSD